MSSGIRFMGDAPVSRFCSLTGATPASHADPKGDAILNARYVEVKWAGGNIVSQVRPAHFTPLVVGYPAGWIVVPAADVIEAVAKSSRRGQHGANPFLCVSFGIGQWKKNYTTDDIGLLDSVLHAFSVDDERDDLRLLMEAVVDHAERDRLAWINRVKEAQAA